MELLRRAVGVPAAGSPGVLVVAERSGRPLPPGQIELEDGGDVPCGGRLPDAVPTGYHRLVDHREVESSLIVTPRRCHLPTGPRAWGWATQLYATRSDGSWGIGDFADLDRLARWSVAVGAGYLLLNPLGAVVPGTPPQASPYFLSSRRMRNPIYLRVEQVPGAGGVAEVEGAARAGRLLGEDRLIDREKVWREKARALEAIWLAGPPMEEFERWRRAQPSVLEQFARWSALVELHGPRWAVWPADCRSADGPGVAAVARQHPGRVSFHAWLQWLAEGQLERARNRLAVISDLPIGVDPEGFDAWSWQELFAPGISVGAPPDEFNENGQDWGFAPFVPWRLRQAGYGPFIETVRALMAPGGGLRIDHVMGLFRLWWIPGGADPNDGAYVRYPAEDLLGIVALESRRAAALVIGEDLGTVEESARAILAERDILSYRLLWFEETAPSGWPVRAVGAVSTHDLPTVAGLWTGSDLEEQRAAGLEPNLEATGRIRNRLAAARGSGEKADPGEAVLAAYGLLAEAPCRLLLASLEDAVVEPRRPNLPGSGAGRPNWSLALPVLLEELEVHPTALGIARVLGAAVRGPCPPDSADHPEAAPG